MTLRSLICIAVVLALVPSLAFADVKPADRAQITKAYRTAEGKLNKKDIDGALKVMTDDFTSKGLDGKTETKDQMANEMKQHLATVKTFKANFSPGKMTQKGDQILVSCGYSFTGTIVDPKAKKTHRLSDKGTSVDTWVKQNNTWMLKNITEKTDKMLIDGKPPKAGKI